MSEAYNWLSYTPANALLQSHANVPEPLAFCDKARVDQDFRSNTSAKAREESLDKAHYSQMGL
jgi:hypothetical protein